MAKIHRMAPARPVAEWGGFEYVRPQYLAQLIDVNEATEVFRNWLAKAGEHLPPDELAFAEALIHETREQWHVLLMVDFVASAYKREHEKREAA